MKRTLLLTLEYPPDRGGVATYLAALHQNLANVTVVRGRTWRWWPQWLPMVWQTAHLMRREQIEMLAVSQVLPVGYVALLMRSWFRVPYVVFVHGLDVQLASRSAWKKWWLQKILQQAQTVVANSDFTRQLVLEQGIADANLRVIRPCVEALGTHGATHSDDFTLLTVGRLVLRKNHAAVLRAVAEIRSSFPTVRYIIVGDGPERERLSTLIHTLQLDDRVILVPHASDAERDAYYESADVFVLPVISAGDDVEGFGLVFLEAARFGVPVVAGRGGGVGEAVIDGETGMLIDPQDGAALAASLRLLLSNRERRAELGARGRARVAKQFLCSNRIADMRALYD